MSFAVGLLPSTAGADVTDSIIATVTADIVPILVIVGVMLGLKWVFKLFNKSTHGKL